MNDNKKILLNTGVLYVKLFLSTIIGLVCSRIILNALGSSDYGLYSVVGGVVTFLNVIGTTMVSVSYRYLAVELGKGNLGNANKVYNTVYIIHLVLAVCLILIGETFGSYYINNILNVVRGKVADAQFVLHVSLVTTAISVMSVPANALIIAREKFLFTSLTEIGVAVMKLGLVIALGYYLGNRLRAFAIIMAVVTLVTRVAYVVYCRRKESAIIKWHFNKCWNDYKEIFSFAWWSLFGAIAVIGKEQGAAMIINFFFGTALNAAFGLASQVNRYVFTFTNSLNQAAVPQIMKNYGGGNQERSLSIVYVITRISTLILLVMVIPLLFCIDDILRIWLKEVPEYTTIFASWMLINGFVMVLGAGFDPCIQSTGNIRNNEIGYGLINLALLPIVYILYKMGCPPYTNVVVLPFLSVITRLFQIYIMKRQTEFKFNTYFKKSILPSFSTLVVATIPLFALRLLWGHSIMHTICFVAIGVCWTAISILLVGTQKNEKQMLLLFLKTKIFNKNNI